MTKQITFKQMIEQTTGRIVYKVIRLMNLPMWGIGDVLADRQSIQKLIDTEQDDIDIIIE